MNPVIRDMHPAEFPLLEDFLYEAVFQKPGNEPLPRSIIRRPELRPYVEEFGHCSGDVCLCAESDGRVIGAAWARLMQGFGHADDKTPELAMAVLAPHRGKGIGTLLLRALMSRLQQDGFCALSLSVQKDNPAVHLYQKAGFQFLREDEEELVMVRRL